MNKKLLIYILLILTTLQLPAQKRSLDYYITTALSNSPLLKEYQNQILSNFQDSILVKALKKPQANATGQILIPPYGKNWGYDEAITNGGNYLAVVGVTQYIFRKKHTANAYENIALQNKSAQNNIKLSEQELKKLIINQYIISYTSYNELLFQKEVRQLLKEEEIILKQLTEKGTYKQADYLNFVIEVQTQETNILQQQIDYKQELYNLNFLSGISDTATYILSDPEIVQSNKPDYSDSPVYRQFAIDSMMNSNSKQALKLNYSPTLGWFADAGINSADPLQTYRHVGFSFGLNFTMPIYDGKQRKYEMQKLTIKDNSRLNYEDFFKKQYNSKLMQISEKIDSYDKLAVQINKQLSSIEALIKLNKQQLNTGDLSVSDHILTIKNYIETKHQLNTLQLEKLQEINEWNNISF